jgi:hypothetical protein
MNCISEETVRAKLDGELSPSVAREVAQHLMDCPSCQALAAHIDSRTLRVTTRLALLDSESDEMEPNPQIALTRVKARILESERQSAAREQSGLVRWPAMLVARMRRPLWGGAVFALILVLVIGVTNLGGARTWAQQVLGLIHVEQAVPAPVTNDQLSQQQYNALNGTLAQLLSDDVTVTKYAGPLQPAATAADASMLAGFNVRLPANAGATPALSVMGENSYRMTLNLARLQSMVNDAGRPDIQLPSNIDGAQIDIDIPKAVFATYGGCPPIGPGFNPLNSEWNDCLGLIELTPPVVLAGSNLNLPDLAALGLQVGGMSEGDADAFIKTVDWTSMLVLPVPEHFASYQMVPVDGVQGVMIDQNREPGAPAAFALLWFKDGVDYWLVGRGDSSKAVSIANSLPQ